MRILDLSTNEKDAVTFFQEKSILPKKRVRGFGHKAKLYFRKQFFWKCNFQSCQKGMYSCWEIVYWQSYLFCVCIALYVLSGRETDFCKMVSKAINICGDNTVDWNNYNYYLFENRWSHDNQIVVYQQIFIFVIFIYLKI